MNMFRHKETQKLVTLVSMDNDVTFRDHEGKEHTCSAHEFNSKYDAATLSDAELAALSKAVRKEPTSPKGDGGKAEGKGGE